MLVACVLSRVQLCDTRDCCPPSSSDHGIFQARRLEWVAISCSSGSSGPKDGTRVSCVSCFGRWILYHGATWEALGEGEVNSLSHLYSCICTSTHSFIPSPNEVNTEHWGLRDNSDTACPLLTLPPRHRAPGSQWRDERVPLGACGQGGEGQAETQPGKRSISFVVSGGRLRAKLPVEGSRLRHPCGPDSPASDFAFPCLISLAHF